MLRKEIVFAVSVALGLGTTAFAAGKPDRPDQAGGRFERLKGLDADKDGSVSSAEFLKDLQERFARRDANSDGRLTAEELAGSRRARAASPEDRADRYIKRFDANADGKVTASEVESGQRDWFQKRDKDADGRLSADEAPRFMSRRGGAGRSAETVEEAVERASRRFKTFDANGDASIDKAEIVAAETERRAYRLRRLMHRLDANRDGKVTLEEFMARSKDRFATLDLDSDGRITAADLPPQQRAEWNAR